MLGTFLCEVCLDKIHTHPIRWLLLKGERLQIFVPLIDHPRGRALSLCLSLCLSSLSLSRARARALSLPLFSLPPLSLVVALPLSLHLQSPLTLDSDTMNHKHFS